MKKEVPLAITFISGFLLIIALFVPHPPFGNLEERFNDWYIIVAGFTLILGVDSLLAHHWRVIRRREPGTIHSIALILSFILTLIWAGYSGYKHGNPFDPASTFLRYFYTYVFVSLQATMFSLLAFFIASAAYRAFRARTLDATLLLVTAALVMLGNVPKGNLAIPPAIVITGLLLAYHFFREGVTNVELTTRVIYFGAAIIVILLLYPISNFLYHNIPQVKDWIMNVPHLGAKRGILIGIALGAVAISIRIILGIERTYLR